MVMSEKPNNTELSTQENVHVKEAGLQPVSPPAMEPSAEEAGGSDPRETTVQGLCRFPGTKFEALQPSGEIDEPQLTLSPDAIPTGELLVDQLIPPIAFSQVEQTDGRNEAEEGRQVSFFSIFDKIYSCTPSNSKNTNRRVSVIVSAQESLLSKFG